VEALVSAGAFLVLGLTGLVLDGFAGFGIGRVGAALIALGVRSVYVRRLLPDVRLRQLIGPTVIPISLACLVVLALRLALWGGARPLVQAIAELALFVAIYSVLALRRERALMVELLGALRFRGQTPAQNPSALIGDDHVLPAGAEAPAPGAGMEGSQG